MRYQASRVALLSLLVLAVSSIAGCVDEKIVYQDRELFEDPPAAAASFLGYTDYDTKLTVCGNCHVEKQGEWEETAHASAWAGLQSSGHAQGFCEGCHTVSELGNTVTGEAGYTATSEQRYEDVQCEACHGPGLTHVNNPTDETVPLAPMSVGLELTTGCGECHQDTHHPFVEEWAQSRHGSVNAYPAGRSYCAPCHTGEGALQAWGVNTEYIEKDLVAQDGEHLAIVCAVCHDPHGGPNDAQLRFPIDAPNEEQNLCMKCHHKRGVPDPTSFRGPHSPEGPTLLGYAGYCPSTMEWESEIVGTHGTPEANPKLCARCHVYPFEVTDSETGEFVLNATGHVFSPVPCLDENGAPIAGGDCADSERTYAACTGSGCHGSESVARSVRFTAESRMENLTDELDGLLAQVPESEFNHEDNRYTAAEGARFNSQLALNPGSAVHNPFLVEALLLASIKEVKATYGVNAATKVDLNPVFQLNH